MKQERVERFVYTVVHGLVLRGMPKDGMLEWLNRLHLEQQDIIKKTASDGVTRTIAVQMMTIIQAIERRYVELLIEKKLEGVELGPDNQSVRKKKIVGVIVGECVAGLGVLPPATLQRVDWVCPDCQEQIQGIDPHTLQCLCCKAVLMPNSANNAFVLKR